MLRKITFSPRLVIGFFIVVLLFSFIIYQGEQTMEQLQANLASVYKDRVVALEDLKIIPEMYTIQVVETAQKLRNGNITWREARKNVEEARFTIAYCPPDRRMYWQCRKWCFH
jgi:methyl-accepting chemotaxis protein